MSFSCPSQPARRPARPARVPRSRAAQFLVLLLALLCVASPASAATSTYHADGTTADSTGGHNGTWSGAPVYSAGRTGAPADRAFSMSGFEHVFTDGEVGRFGTTDIVTISLSFRTTSVNQQSLI